MKLSLPQKRHHPDTMMVGIGVSGLALGATLAYLLDPDRGGRRRALLRDKARHATRSISEAAETSARDIANRSRGASASLRRQVSEMRDRMQGRMIPDDVLVATGLGFKNRSGRSTDAFRGRLLFPIFDPEGRPVAFGGLRSSSAGGTAPPSSSRWGRIDRSGSVSLGARAGRARSTSWTSAPRARGRSGELSIHCRAEGGTAAPLARATAGGCLSCSRSGTETE